MRNAIRILWIFVLISFFGLESFGDYFLAKNQIVGSIFVVIGALSGISLFICLLYHWVKTKFTSKAWKFLWLVVLFLNYYALGALTYYLSVVEFQKTVFKEA